jgi:hypothetical protein
LRGQQQTGFERAPIYSIPLIRFGRLGTEKIGLTGVLGLLAFEVMMMGFQMVLVIILDVTFVTS